MDNFKIEMQEENLDIGKILRYLFMQSKLIISTTVLVFVISFIIYSLTPKTYKIFSLLQIEPSNQNLLSGASIDLMPLNQSGDINNLILIYKSRTNIMELIMSLDLNVQIQGVNKDEFIDFEFIDDENTSPLSELYLEFDDNSFLIFDYDKKFIKKANYGEYISLYDMQFIIKDTNINKGKKIKFIHERPDALYNTISKKLNVKVSSTRGTWFRQDGLMEISYITPDIDLGKAIINRANEIFLKYRISIETEKARKAIDYIDKNLKSVEKGFNLQKEKLKSFRETNKSLNVDLEIESVLSRIQDIDNSLYSIQVEIAEASDLYTRNNPIYINLINKRDILEDQKNEVLSVINKLPKEQQEYIDLYRDVEITQILFEELESRKLGFSIMEASTIGNIRIIDKAYKSALVGPLPINVILATMIAGVLISVFAIFRGIRFLPITNPAEIHDSGIDEHIVAVLPEVDETEISDLESSLNYQSSIETFIVNIETIKEGDSKKNVILITSPGASNGKSTISSSLAKSLASLGHKVLLFDNDLKKGVLAKKFDRSSISYKDFLNISDDNIDEYKINNNLYMVPRVKRLSSTFQFLTSKAYSQKLEYFKEKFDFVIIDTAPLLVTSDTSTLITKSDINFIVCRHNLTKINELKQLIANFNQLNKRVDGFIYNAYAKPKGYYGYYGIYGNYAYTYYADKYLEEKYEYKE